MRRDSLYWPNRPSSCGAHLEKPRPNSGRGKVPGECSADRTALRRKSYPIRGMAAPRLPLARRPDDARADSSSAAGASLPRRLSGETTGQRGKRIPRAGRPQGTNAGRRWFVPRRPRCHQREIYHSENGDRWLLCRDDDGRVFVLHKANLASGGTATKIELGDFLGRGKAGPEHQALARLIGSLVDSD